MTDMLHDGNLPKSCATAQNLLEKAFFDEPLTQSEQASLAQHLGCCENCALIGNVPKKLKVFRSVSLTGDPLTIIRDSLKNYQRQQKRRRMILAGLAAAAIFILFLIAVYYDNDFDSAPTVAIQRLIPGRSVSLLSGAAMVALSPDAQFAPSQSNDKTFGFVLRQGTAAVWVEPKRKIVFFIDTRWGKIVVVGTRFMVQLYPDNDRLDVLDGQVKLYPATNNNKLDYTVPAGFSTALRRVQLEPISPERAKRLRQMLHPHNSVAERDASHDTVGTPDLRRRPAGSRDHNPLPGSGLPNPHPNQNGSWSFWFDRDDPSGTGDGERLDALLYEGYPVCAKPLKTQCRTVGDHRDWRLTGEILACNKEGVLCLNKDQSDGQCEDYEVRFFCGSQSFPEKDKER